MWLKHKLNEALELVLKDGVLNKGKLRRKHL